MSLSNLAIVTPVTITDAIMIASNVPETDYAEYNSATSYNSGDRAITAATHTIWQSVFAGAQSNNTPSTSPTYWTAVSNTNKWKAFDLLNSTQTAKANLITYQLRPGIAYGFLTFLNLVGITSIQVQIVDPTYGTVYNNTVSLPSTPGAAAWYSWFFGPKQTPTQLILTDIPSFPNADTYITLNGTSALAVGVIMPGIGSTFGLGIKYGASLGIQDYSRKDKNAFGDTILVQRAFAKRGTFDMYLTKAEVDPFINLATTLRATPCLFIAGDQYDNMAIFGFYKEFKVLINYSQHSDCTLDIEGLT